MRLTQMFVHPMKSGRGIEYASAYAAMQGLLHDREWLVTTPDGRFLTARDYPGMVRIEMDLIPGGMLLKAQGRNPIMAMTQVYKHAVATAVWKDEFTAYHGDTAVDAWLSETIGTPCQLLWLGMKSTRAFKGSGQALSFADGYPFLLVNHASLNALNAELASPVTTRHFRPNFVVDAEAPYEEDDWLVVRIGELIFDVAKPCTRCQLTTVNPENGQFANDNEPMRTLIRTRQLPEGICFGVNLVARNEGLVQVGDEFEVLESRYGFE
ncbi:MOSC N-terminal beta barrel domain-containing protein [uncultured Aquitalea sp.]|uniref:MOSC domain-containing protein n=1 Tax=uncultured Aquitalea sp. TaxID=540272 RepID=UPI0025F480C9|nr:MOSC N-terminal beta barrel domain-containing protein [uncultured Aquitalea sp.]